MDNLKCGKDVHIKWQNYEIETLIAIRSDID